MTCVVMQCGKTIGEVPYPGYLLMSQGSPCPALLNSFQLLLV